MFVFLLQTLLQYQLLSEIDSSNWVVMYCNCNRIRDKDLKQKTSIKSGSNLNVFSRFSKQFLFVLHLRINYWPSKLQGKLNLIFCCVCYTLTYFYILRRNKNPRVLWTLLMNYKQHCFVFIDFQNWDKVYGVQLLKLWSEMRKRSKSVQVPPWPSLLRA